MKSDSKRPKFSSRPDLSNDYPPESLASHTASASLLIIKRWHDSKIEGVEWSLLFSVATLLYWWPSVAVPNLWAVFPFNPHQTGPKMNLGKSSEDLVFSSKLYDWKSKYNNIGISHINAVEHHT